MRICPACKKQFIPKKPSHFLCPLCAHMAFVEKKCPLCGGAIIRKGKPMCAECAAQSSAQHTDAIRCNYVFPDGERCKRWAMRGSYWCKNHQGGTLEGGLKEKAHA